MEKFDIKFELHYDEYKNKFWVAVLNKEAQDLMGDIPQCQKCSKPLGLPLYICSEQKYKWFCKECQFSNQKLCDHELSKDHHEHVCIKKIENELAQGIQE